tara:strand:+ start:112 stop:255 length:144 start_codon:yes stop_codon:yes gene_type:complete
VGFISYDIIEGLIFKVGEIMNINNKTIMWIANFLGVIIGIIFYFWLK